MYLRHVDVRGDSELEVGVLVLGNNGHGGHNVHEGGAHPSVEGAVDVSVLLGDLVAHQDSARLALDELALFGEKGRFTILSCAVILANTSDPKSSNRSVSLRCKAPQTRESDDEIAVSS